MLGATSLYGNIKMVNNMNKGKNMWDIISTLSGVIAAIVALITVYIAISSLQKENQYKRPYFIIEKPGIKALPESPPYRMQITLYNTGVHPATDLVGSIKILDYTLDQKPQFDFKFSVANEIPHDSPTPWYNDDVMLPNNLKPQYVILNIEYGDPILKESFSQSFFMRWNGIQNGTTHPDFVHVQIEERNKIKEFFKKLGIPLL